MTFQLFCIVEGHGDVLAVPVLLRRLVADIRPDVDLDIPKPLRVGRHKLVKPGELERSIEFGARKIGRPGAILVLVDADDDCPATLGPDLLSRARRARSDVDVAVVLAKHEFEAWFRAAFASLAGKRGFPRVLPSVENPEEIRNAKRPIEEHRANRIYSETLDQPALAALIDLGAARTSSPSFDKCWREIERLLAGADLDRGLVRGAE